MRTPYFCPNERRRALVRESGSLNGIDFLEVLDHDAPAGVAPQQTLLVHCFLPPTGIDARHVRLDGGERVTGIRALWATRADAPPPDPDLAPLLALLPDPARVLVVRTSTRGDFSAYTLRLVGLAGDDEPPTGFDTILSSVDFSFKVECPTPFDCPHEPPCPPEPAAPAPPIDYLARDFAAVRQLLLDRLSVTLPDWTERSPADIGVVVAELLAYRTDYLSYYQDAVATEAYLGTARRRVSVRRHARLVDYHVHEGTNARIWIAFTVERGGDADGATLPAGTVVRDATDPRAPLRQGIGAPAVFETMHSLPLSAERNAIPLYDWGDPSCCLPRGATRATLDGAAAALALRRGDLLILRTAPGSPLDRRHALRLSADPRARIDPLDGRPVTEIRWFDADALPFALPIGATGAFAQANVALADHGETRVKILSPPPVDGRPYRPTLARTQITQAPPYDHRRALRAPAGDALCPSVGLAALPAVTLRDGETTWKARRELLASDRFAPEFVVEIDEDGTASLRFGDSVQGRAPDPDSALVATYRVGGLTDGDIGAGVLTRVDAPWDAVQADNPLPAVGGAGPETLRSVRLKAPAAFRTLERMVTDADHVALAQRHPDVQRAAATRRWVGSWYVVFLTIDRKGGRPVDTAFTEALRAFLEPYRIAGNDLEITPPVFVSLDLHLRVCVAPGADHSAVRTALESAFSAGDGGFFHPDNLTFGQPVFLSRVIAAAQAVPGVETLVVERFRRWGQPDRGEIDAGEIAFGRLEVARLDNDPNRPENGRIEFSLQGKERPCDGL